jgi:hypothetical protein
MTTFIIRCAIAIAALLSLQYSGQFNHVDVSVSAPCAAGISAKTDSGQTSCIYRDVSKRGRVMHRDFEVYGPSGAGFFTTSAKIISRSDQTGFTWRTAGLLLIAVAVWIPSLLTLFVKSKRSETIS